MELHLAWPNTRLELDNDSSLIGPLVTYLQEHVSRMGLCDETDRMRIGVALEEALTNAMYHGNLQVGSELREEDDRAYCAWSRPGGTRRPTRSGGSTSAPGCRATRRCSWSATKGRASTLPACPTPPIRPTSNASAAAASC